VCTHFSGSHALSLAAVSHETCFGQWNVSRPEASKGAVMVTFVCQPKRAKGCQLSCFWVCLSVLEETEI
jgi:hypothetical protein